MQETEKRSVGRPSTYKPEYGERIVELMSTGLSLVAAAADLNIGRSKVYRWIDEHPDFAELYEIAKGKRQIVLEQDLLSTNSGPVVTSRIFALKNASPDWREKQEIEHSGKIDSDVTHKLDVSSLSDDELAVLAKVVK